MEKEIDEKNFLTVRDYQELDSILKSWWNSLPKKMQSELNNFYEKEHQE